MHVIMDNSMAHETAAVRAWLEKYPRFTPTSTSWLNTMEGWFAQLERQALFRDAFSSVADLRAAIRRFIEVHNKH